MLSLHCKDGRALEIICVVSVAPGFLSNFTKIVRFLPRYLAINLLPYPIRLWQDNSIFLPLSADSTSGGVSTSRWRFSRAREKRNESIVNQYEAIWGRETVLDENQNRGIPSGTAAHGSALFIATVMPSEIIPFSLPDSRGERHLRIDLGQPCNLTSSISADIPGDHIIKVRKAVNLRSMPHVSTRSNPQYEVQLPMGDESLAGELGIWFETEWGESRSFIVKAVKKNSFAFNETDIHIGDELLAIDGAPVFHMTFLNVMNVIREQLIRCNATAKDAGKCIHSEVKCTLVFRTVEERLRRVRMKAAKASSSQQLSKMSSISTRHSNKCCSSVQSPDPSSDIYIQAGLKPLQHSDLSTLLLLRMNPAIPFQIQNRSVHCTIYYRQRGCNQHSWNFLKPGQANAYTWEEPLKPKKLTVRAASNNDFQYSEKVIARDSHPESPWSGKIMTSARKVIHQPFGKVKSEEASVFSPSVTVRLEEIGFEETLSVSSEGLKNDENGASICLQLEVSVEGSTRVLAIFDASREGNEHQLECHLESLEKKIGSEQSRLEQLNMLNIFVTPLPTEALGIDTKNIKAANSAMQLMNDFSSAATISQCHQIVVEVLEAVGLSPDSFVTSCNPYAEISLNAAGLRRNNLCKQGSLRRTYYVRKSVNPTWNSQAFVFNVPCEAVSVTRGHSIQVCLKNFRVFGTHHTLGRAQVDLHSVRNQKPLLGWFPLIGRTGKRELENQVSHWGRGSVKLRVQWIHSIPALIQYFIILSERRLLELEMSLEGMSGLLQNEKEIQEKRITERDGFKAARVEDLLALSRINTKARNAQIQKLKRLNRSVAKRSTDAANTHIEQRSTIRNSSKKSYTKLMKNPNQGSGSFPLLPPSGNALMRKIPNSLHHNGQNIENQISQQKKSIQRYTKTRPRFDRKHSLNRVEGMFAVPYFKFWSWAQAVFNDRDFEIELKGESIKVTLRLCGQSTCEAVSKLSDSEYHETSRISQYFKLPPETPAVMRNSISAYVSEFTRSRSCFERVASMSLSTMLHTGGWLTIRPITALNLPELYTGMFVKVRYGSEVLVSETVDARVMPTWYKPDANIAHGDGVPFSLTGSSVEDEIEDISSNDLHIHVAPQKTSCSVRLSVIGERSQTQLHAKTELGLLDLPVGALIAACLDSRCTSQEHGNMNESLSMFPTSYVRWFPLISPKDASQVEGDEGYSTRPPDTEKTDSSMFQDYFAPCIQLAVSWSSDEEERKTSKATAYTLQAAVQGCGNSKLPTTSQTLIRHYLNADLSRISFSLIDSQRGCELLSLCIQDIGLRYWTTNSKKRLGMTIGWLQLDFQDSEREPVVLAPTPTDFRGPVLQAMLVQDHSQNASNIIALDLIDVSLTELDLTIEERLVFDIAGFFESIQFRKGARQQVRAGGTRAQENLKGRSLSAATNTGIQLLLESDFHEGARKQSKMYIKQLYLGVVKINLSYLKGKTSSTLGRVNNRLSQLLTFAGGEYLLDLLSFEKEKSNIFQSWQKHTFDEERHVEEQGVLSVFHVDCKLAFKCLLSCSCRQKFS